MDRDAICLELSKDLNSAYVKPPAPGKYGDYIEGWRVISEANRIFGWDGWSYRVDRLEQTNCDDGQGRNSDQWAVGYLCAVTVRVADTERQDVGHGQGHSRSIGDAHDSAAKEAVTDALKRALRTFGNPLGLALYDKTKANVSNNPDYNPAGARNALMKSLGETPDDELAAWKKHNANELERLRQSDHDEYNLVLTEAKRRANAIKNREEAA